MKLLLVRHGHDLPGANGESGLSLQGKKQAATTAERISDFGIRKAQIVYSSPARRAVETLDEIDFLVPSSGRQPAEELQPGESTDALNSLVMRHWNDQPEVMLLVGHEPQLSNAVLRWCGLPENDTSGDTPPWILPRGEGMVLSPSMHDARISLTSSDVTFLGRQRAIPSSAPSKRVGVF